MPNGMSMSTNQYDAIDPMALMLSGQAYKIWIEFKHPHVPSVADLAKVLQRMSPRERAFALERAKTLVAYGKAVEKAATRSH